MAYSNDNTNGYRPDEEDELWDDDIALSSGEDVSGMSEPSERSESSESSEYSEISEYSEPSEYSEHAETSEPSRPRRRRFGLGRPQDSEEGDDFYDSESEPEPEPKKEKKAPVLDPENPDYWIEDEPEIPSIIPKGNSRWKWWVAIVAVFLALIVGTWIWMFNPHVDGAVRYGYILHMERRGSVVKTFEGVMVPYREIDDVSPLHFEKLRFSVASDTTAAKMKGMMLKGVPVRIEYKVYHTSLPWRGDEKTVVVKADTADVNKILPPDFQIPGEGKK